MVRSSLLALVITLVAAACQSPRDADASDSAGGVITRVDTTTRSAASADTQGTGVATTTKTDGDTAMAALTAYGRMVVERMDAMEAQMKVMDTASAATIQARMPRYGPMADSLVSRMNEEVRRKNIATDAIWPATADSVRQDLSRLQSATATDMKAMMPAHLKRMRWLIQMQRTMTGKTPP